MGKSCIHIYCGDGKGKSTAVMGLALRAAGSGKKVVLTQFLKNGKSSELKILRDLPQVTVLTCPKQFGFFWKMTEEQKKEAGKGLPGAFRKSGQGGCGRGRVPAGHGRVHSGLQPRDGKSGKGAGLFKGETGRLGSGADRKGSGPGASWSLRIMCRKSGR